MITPENHNPAIDFKPLRVFDLLFLLYAIPFIVASLHLATNGADECFYLLTYPYNFGVPVYLRVDAFVMLGFAVDCIITIVRSCCCFQSRCSFIFWTTVKWIYCAWRLGWIVLGAVIFWKYQNPQSLCPVSVSRYLWVFLILGMIHMVVTVLFLVLIRPQLLVIVVTPPPVTSMVIPGPKTNTTFMNGTTISMM